MLATCKASIIATYTVALLPHSAVKSLPFPSAPAALDFILQPYLEVNLEHLRVMDFVS